MVRLCDFRWSLIPEYVQLENNVVNGKGEKRERERERDRKRNIDRQIDT